MQYLPPWLTATIGGPFQLIPRVEWSPDWTTWYPLRAVSGSHSQDRTRQMRWQMSGTFMKDYLVGDAGVHPYGPRLRIYLGVKTIRNPVWWLPQGVYTIESVQEDEDTIQIAGSSYEVEVANSDFVKSRKIPDYRNESYRAAAEKLITEAVSDARFQWDDLLGYTQAIPTGYFTTGRWDLIDGNDTDVSIMGALGGEAYCDATGAFRFVTMPTLQDPSVWTVANGGAKVTSLRQYDREGVFNVVSAGGNSADGSTTIGPVWAWDDDPSSFTYAGPDPVNRPGDGSARYGVKPTSYTNTLITNDRQAGVAARAQLAKGVGLHYAVSLTAYYNPALEAGDVIEVENYQNLFEKHLLDSMTYTWGEASFQCVARSPKDLITGADYTRISKSYIGLSDAVKQVSVDDNPGQDDSPPPPPSDGTGSTSGTTTSGKASFKATSIHAFKSDNSTVHSTSQIYQGYWSSTWGNNRSMVGFNYTAIRAALSGKNVTGVTLKFRTQHAYYNAGCTAVIGTNNATSQTTFNSYTVNRKKVGSCSAGKWTTVSLGATIAKEFQTGASNGIVFGPGPSNSLTYYGYHYGTGSNAPVLTFTYTTTT